MHQLLGVICGVDEAGRGPLAGPVYAAAVILGDAHGIEGLAELVGEDLLDREPAPQGLGDQPGRSPVCRRLLKGAGP